MKNITNLNFKDLTQQDIYYALLYLEILGFDLDKNTSRQMLGCMVELKELATQDNTTIKAMYLKEKNNTLN